MRAASWSSVARSGPNTLTARSPRTPEISSDTRISIGWVKLVFTPGNRSVTSRMRSTTQALSCSRHSSRGFSFTKPSVSFVPIGSRPSSSEPTRATMRSIFRHLVQQRLLDLQVGRRRTREADGRQLLVLDHHVAFVHRRHERLAEQHEQAQRRDQRDPGAGEHHASRAPATSRAAAGSAPRASAPAAACVDLAAEQPRGGHRHHCQRQHQRGEQREHDGEGHRLEQLAFESLQAQQRQEHDRDDGDAGGDRHGHFGCGAIDHVQPRPLRTLRAPGPGGPRCSRRPRRRHRPACRWRSRGRPATSGWRTVRTAASRGRWPAPRAAGSAPPRSPRAGCRGTGTAGSAPARRLRRARCGHCRRLVRPARRGRRTC